MPRAPGTRGFAFRLGLVAAGALALRLVYVLGLSRHLVGRGDSAFFHETANLLGSGHGYIVPLSFNLHGSELPTAQHPPVTSGMLAAVSALGLDSYPGQRVVMTLVGAATVVVVGLVARELAGEPAGLAAAVIFAVYPSMVATDGAVMSEAPFGLFTALSLLAAFRLTRGGGRAAALALGSAVGLAALSRAEGLLLLPLLLLPALLAIPARRLALAALAVLACAVVVLPWSARNWVRFDRPVLLSTNDGSLLAGANCDRTYRGRDTGGWAFNCVPRVQGDNEAVVAAAQRRHGLDYIGDNLGRVPVVAVVRVLRTFSVYQPFRQAEHAEGRDPTVEKAGAVFFWLLVLAAIAGAVAVAGRDLVLLAAPIVVAVVVSAGGYGVPRFREPADVALVALAGVAVARGLRRRGPRASAAPAR